jgi:hypothetical protein
VLVGSYYADVVEAARVVDEDSAVLVEDCAVGSVRTSILGIPRRLPSHQLAGPSAERRYDLIWGKPDIGLLVLAVRAARQPMKWVRCRSTHH